MLIHDANELKFAFFCIKGIAAQLGVFYHSEVCRLMRDGAADMHCMSDAHLAEDLLTEYRNT